ncbi:ABC transporter permease [Eisenibacter elegans]|uniref:ABC transporter permease n=1 Tax=Eisenibacter elegans TaxID=997 RepID=UPI00047BCA3A|nr:FtsX-like permease family protein [Eisenibacter elegans]
MSIYYFIAQRAIQNTRASFSSIVARVAIVSVALGLSILLIAFGVLVGFKQAIQEKLFSFSGHLQVTKYTLNQSYEETPISTQTHLYQNYGQHPVLRHLYAYSLKAGIIKTQEEVMGVIIKGLGEDYPRERFRHNMVAGGFLDAPSDSTDRQILISQKIATKLALSIGDTALIFFVQDPPRFRKLVVQGIYETGLEGFDDKFVIGQLPMIQRLNGWPDTLVGGYEIFTGDFEQLNQAAELAYELMEYDMQLSSTPRKFPEIFEWLYLLNTNVRVFLTLILAVASFNMIAILLIMIMERVQMIGTLKALGASNWQIRQIFIYQGMILIVKGLFWGNVIGLGFCVLQYYFKLIPLNTENYYMSTVPIAWDWWNILGVNLLTFLLVSAALLVPTIIITQIEPIRAIKFD